ncbi:MAG: LuxR C-terminal-related transcriptional regulator, partial [Acidobacteriota bacterium]
LAEDADQAARPRRMRILGASGDERWLRVLPISIRDDQPHGPLQVECALDDSRTHRMEAHLRRVAARHARHGNGDGAGATSGLTTREAEILDLLTDQDLDLASIARQLHVSYVTVRNHVQHTLTKLHVHSIPEAVAVNLLHRPD